ncbi:MAG: hypothetical protein Q7T50_02760, partial [Candidatus Magasanikbacteria bacterium]|nr:hypothetical protein [Candidatus Magasanikbacteria bacterium]
MKDSPEYQKKEIKFEVTTWAIGMVLFFTIFAIFNFVDLNKYQWILIPIVLSIILFFYIVSKKRVSLYKKYHEREDNIIPLDKPLSRGGANFASRRIIFRDNLAHTKDTWFNFVLNNIFLFIAFCLIAVTIYNFLVSHNRLIIPTTFLAVIFSILGLVIKIFTTKHINF